MPSDHDARSHLRGGEEVVVYAAVGRSLRVARLDPATGDLDWRDAIDLDRGEVQYAAMHPGGRHLYAAATDRKASNLLYTFTVDARSGRLAAVDAPFALPPQLGRAVHISVDHTGQYVLMAHHVTESVSVLALGPDGRPESLVAQPAIAKLGFLVHQIRVDPANKTVFVPVRGKDAEPPAAERTGRLHIFSMTGGLLSPRRTIEYESGIGPRHLDFHTNGPWVYVAAERGNILITYERNDGDLVEVSRTTTLKNRSFRFPSQRAGAIHVHPNGKWLYVTNRNVAPCMPSVPCADRHTKPFVDGENNIAQFSIDGATGRPALVGHVDSHGFEPRTFAIDPGGHFLFVGNMMQIARQSEDGRIVDVPPNVAVFRIAADGKLQFVRAYDQVDAGQVMWIGAY